MVSRRFLASPGREKAAEHDRQGPGLLRHGDHVVEDPLFPERDPIEETEGRHGDDDRARRKTALVGQVDLVGADRRWTETSRGTVEVAGEPRDGLDVCLLGARRQLPHLHVFEHALTKRCHGTLLCEGPGGFQALARAAYGETADELQRRDDLAGRLRVGRSVQRLPRSGLVQRGLWDSLLAASDQPVVESSVMTPARGKSTRRGHQPARQNPARGARPHFRRRLAAFWRWTSFPTDGREAPLGPSPPGEWSPGRCG